MAKKLKTYTEKQWKYRFRNYEGGDVFPSRVAVEWDDPSETPTEAIIRLNTEAVKNGKRAESLAAGNTGGPWWAGVDWPALREQKLTLVQLAESARTLGPPPRDAGTITDHVGGIVHLLDALMDQAAEVLGERAVFGELAEAE